MAAVLSNSNQLNLTNKIYELYCYPKYNGGIFESYQAYNAVGFYHFTNLSE
jgi:hypothetical protein